MSEDLRVVYSAEDTVRVRQLKLLLEQAGIAVRVVTAGDQEEVGESPFVMPSGSSLAVDRRDAAAAQQIAGEFEAEADDHTAGEWLPDKPETLSVRPVCPGCGKQRITACPVCGTTGGANFYDAGGPLADDREAESAESIMLVCQTCDEAFVPEYPRVCEWCGHDFGEGSQIDENLQIDGDDEPLEMVSGRVIATVIALTALLLAAAAYFALVL